MSLRTKAFFISAWRPTRNRAGEGCYLYDEAGNRYADFIAQFGAVPFGHDPATIWEALSLVRQQCQPNLVITSISAAAGELAERLLAIAPEGLNHAVFTNSGAEAIEAAIKLARCRTGRVGILSTRDGFHGLTLRGNVGHRPGFLQRGFGAPVLGFNYVPFGDVEVCRLRCKLVPFSSLPSLSVSSTANLGSLSLRPPI
jgi:4-aminobutyrate aminotransferase-like enzyme